MQLTLFHIIMKRAAKSTSQITKNKGKCNHESSNECSKSSSDLLRQTGKFFALCIVGVCFLFVHVVGDGDCVAY
jgi:hypothetical protein